MELFPVSEDEQNEIYKIFNSNEDLLRKDIQLLEEWMDKQSHLPKEFQYANFLKSMLTKSKFSVERAKIKIENYFTLKTFNHDFYEIFAPKDFILQSENLVTISNMPNLGPQLERITVVELKSTESAKEFTFEHFLQAVLAFCELFLKYDRASRHRVVADCRNFNFDFIKRLDLAKFTRFLKLVMVGYCAQMISIDLVNVSAPVGILISIFKKVVKPKLAQRINVHDDLESLYRVIPKQYLPMEFGGTQRSFRAFIEQTDKILLEERDFLESCGKYASDESKRIDPCSQSSTFGIKGTFKQLSFD